MPRLPHRLCTSLLLCLLVPLVPRLAHAADTGGALALAEDDSLYRCKKFADGARIRVTLKPETSLTDLVAWAMGFSCKSFLYGTGVSAHTGKITIMAPTDMTPREAYRLFLVSLSSIQLTLVPHGKTLEIVEESRAREAPLPIVDAAALPADGGMVRMLIKPRHIASADLATVLTSVKSQNGNVLDVVSAGVVVVTVEQPTLVRMLEVAGMVDVEKQRRLVRVEIQNADADDVMKAVVATLPESSKTKLLADPRSNALIVIGPDEDLAHVTELVRLIDVPPRGGPTPRAHVVRLEHADAEETAGVLTGVFTKNGQVAQAGTSRPGTTSGSAAAALPPRVAARASTNAPGASTSVAAATGEVRISFAKATNVVIVIASDEDFRSVREVVRELDVQRPQVYVEAVIMDVSVARGKSIGAALHGGSTGSSGTLIGSTNQTMPGGSASTFTSVVTADTVSSTLVNGLSLSLLGPSFDLLGVTVPSLGALFQAVKTTSDVNVLSSPQLIATDHEEASIKVGENVPTPGSTPVSTGLGTSSVPVQRVDLNLEFKVKPHIGSNGDVTLEITLEIKEPGATTDPSLGPSWTTRAMHTLVTVQDQQPIVIGGLMSDRKVTSDTGVPILGDLPVLGVFFRRHSTTHEKRNLMIVLVPYVVADAIDARHLVARKLRERQEFEQALGNLDEESFDPHVDYRKKRGLVDEIDHQVRGFDDEETLRVAPPVEAHDAAPHDAAAHEAHEAHAASSDPHPAP
jgi:general secretion pathway protein D